MSTDVQQLLALWRCGRPQCPYAVPVHTAAEAARVAAEHVAAEHPSRYTGVRRVCSRHPGKRVYRTMRAAEWAADRCRRREADAHLVQVFECGSHLHVGHDQEPAEPEALREPRPVPPPLTHRLQLPAELVARLGATVVLAELDGPGAL